MKKLKMMPLLCLLAALMLVGCKAEENKIKEVAAQDDYGYVNPDETKAQADAGFVIDGVLDEAAYQDNNWLYLHNEDGGNNVDIAMTSHYGEKGMYFVYDVTETSPIYVNTKRASYMNSCIEMYLAPSNVMGVQENSIFEIDMMPTGDITFKKSNGKYGYENVISTNDKMAYLGTTTKGGEVNTPECYGYTLELFIPWEYMQWLEMDVQAMKNGFVYVNPAHITSNNLNGTDSNLDRYWYFYAQQNGAAFADVYQYFRFNTDGVIGTRPIHTEYAGNCTVDCKKTVIPGMQSIITVTPQAGYSLTSIRINGQEYMGNVSYNQDGSVTLKIRGTEEGITISAKAEPVTELDSYTLTGKISLNPAGSLDGAVYYYSGPTGEKPLAVNSDGSFTLENLPKGYYVLKAEKEGYSAVNRSIYLDRTMQTQMILEYNAFTPTQGACWILDDQNNGTIHKMGGTGALMGNRTYGNFDYSLHLKYDDNLEKQGSSDYFLQQRSGMRIEFSNGKTWHIDILKEKDQYILQYAKFSGEKSATNWKGVHTLTSAEIAKYKSSSGIELRIMRQGRHMAVWLNKTLYVIELFGEDYASATAKLGMEAWIANRTVMTFNFRMSGKLPVDVAGSPFHWPAGIWDISNQYNGTFSKLPAPGKDTWLDCKLDVNDVTTVAKDQSPATNDYSFIYIFKFSNGENFRVRLNHTDDDGKYRIQSFIGSTLFAPWKNHYTLTEEQAKKVQTEGIAYRVQILGTTAYVFLDGQQVCTYDLSTNVNTGKPSGIQNATSTISFRLDGNQNGVTVIPFQFANNYKQVVLNIAETENGKIQAEKKTYKLGDTVKLTVAGDPGYYYSELYVNGEPVMVDWDGAYSFKATQNIYDITGSFAAGPFTAARNSSWNLINQNKGLLRLEKHASGDSGMLNANVPADDVSMTIRDLTPEAKNFSLYYHFMLSNTEQFHVGLNHGADGQYRIESLSGSTICQPGQSLYTLSKAQADKLQSDGITFRVAIVGSQAQVRLDGEEVCSFDLSKLVATGEPSGVEAAEKTVAIGMKGNWNQTLVVPFTLIDSRYHVQINIADMENGQVVTDKVSYNLGDTVTLILTPDAGYSQKLYVNGQPLLLDWKTNTYSFVTTQNVYNITGSFEKSLNLAPSDANRWDSANQAHGVLAAYYPVNDDSWWMKFNGEYETITVKAKNYLPVAESMDGNGSVGFATIVQITMDNGKTYAFRVINDKGTYAYDRYGAGGSVTGWGNWKNLNDLAQQFNGDGVDFKLERTAANKLTLSVNGRIMETYTMDGVTAKNKVTSVGMQHNGNAGQYVQVPFQIEPPVDTPFVQLNIAEFANGTVTADQDSYRVGNTVTLTVQPNYGYSQKLYVNGEPLLLDWKTNAYSFVATQEVYEITGSFEPSLQLTPSDTGRWDSANQAHGILRTYYPVNNDSWWMDLPGNYESITVKAKNYLAVEDTMDGYGDVGFAVILRVTMDNGKIYAFRVINDKGTYAYDRYGAGGSVTGWGNWKNLNNLADTFHGAGVDFKLERTDANKLTMSVNGTVMETYTMDGVTAANKVVSVGLRHNGNAGAQIQIPFQVAMRQVSPDDAPEVKLNIDAMTGGTVMPAATGYKVGDTVVLTVTPNSGYSQKLYINGKPLLVDWKTNTCSFVATEEAYHITGSFEPSLQITPSDTGRWDLTNQAHGMMRTYYPANNDSWWVDFNGDYRSISVKAKNYWSIDESYEGIANGGGFRVALRANMDNGKSYAFSIWIDTSRRYAYNHFGASGSVTGWGGAWCEIKAKDPVAYELLNGAGADFKLERIDGNHFQISINGTVLETYTISDVTAANKVVSVGVCYWGNRGEYVDVPFEVVKATSATRVITPLETAALPVSKEEEEENQ